MPMQYQLAVSWALKTCHQLTDNINQEVFLSRLIFETIHVVSHASHVHQHIRIKKQLTLPAMHSNSLSKQRR